MVASTKNKWMVVWTSECFLGLVNQRFRYFSDALQIHFKIIFTYILSSCYPTFLGCAVSLPSCLVTAPFSVAAAAQWDHARASRPIESSLLIFLRLLLSPGWNLSIYFKIPFFTFSKTFVYSLIVIIMLHQGRLPSVWDKLYIPMA